MGIFDFLEDILNSDNDDCRDEEATQDEFEEVDNYIEHEDGGHHHRTKRHHHERCDKLRHHGYSRQHDIHNEERRVKNGRGVYAWIEKSGMFYSGDIPGVSGIMSVRMKDSFEECLDELTENINGSISVGFSSFRQEVSYEDMLRDYPDAEIVFIPIYKK